MAVKQSITLSDSCIFISHSDRQPSKQRTILVRKLLIKFDFHYQLEQFFYMI